MRQKYHHIFGVVSTTIAMRKYFYGNVFNTVSYCVCHIFAHTIVPMAEYVLVSENVHIWLLMRPSLMWWLSIHFTMFCSEMLHIFIWVCEWVSECLLMCESSAFLMCSLCQCSFSSDACRYINLLEFPFYSFVARARIHFHCLGVVVYYTRCFSICLIRSCARCYCFPSVVVSF